MLLTELKGFAENLSQQKVSLAEQAEKARTAGIKVEGALEAVQQIIQRIEEQEAQDGDTVSEEVADSTDDGAE